MGMFEVEKFAAGTRDGGRGDGRSTRTRVTVVGGGDSAAAVHADGAGATSSPTCPPAAAPRWSSSRAASCRASRRWRRSSRPYATRRTNRRTVLMAAQARRKLIAGNWKMNKTVPEALALVRELRGLVLDAGRQGGDGRGAAVHWRCTAVAQGAARARTSKLAAPELPLGGRGRVHRRGVRADAEGRGVRLRHRRATPSAGSSSARRTRR